MPGFGFLRDVFPDPFKVNWDIADGWATSADLPGVRIPGSPFMGTIGLTPGHELLAATIAREQDLLERGGFILPPSPASAVPADPGIAARALRTVPPREQRRQRRHQAARPGRASADRGGHSRRPVLGG